MYQVQLVAVYA